MWECGKRGQAMTFEKHLFISYAHLDNQPLTAEQQGWVTRFHADLEAMLSMRIGRKAEIWRDQKLSGNDFFGDEIAAQFPKTAILVSVLSPRYVESDWCTQEVREFCKVAEQFGGVELDHKSRVIKVIKTPVDSNGPLPSLMDQMLGYKFYTMVEDRAPLELDRTHGEELRLNYDVRLSELAWEIKELLKRMGDQTSGEKVAPRPSQSLPSIYLAECSYDRQEARETVKAELRLHGYAVLPDRQLPREEADYVAAVARLLEQCKLSIHLVGSSNGAVPDGPSQKSIVVLQNELAIQRCKRGLLRRVIWLPEGTESHHPEQQQFIERLHSDAEAQFGAELITAELETLKGAIHVALEKLGQPERPKTELAGAGDVTLLYLICDERDRSATMPVRKFLRGQGLEVKIPVFEGNATAVRQANQDAMARCDAVILFYGAGDEAWKRSMESDLKKSNGYRGGKPLLASFTYLAGPATADKKDLIELEEPYLINGLQGFSETEIEPLLKALQRV
jgi:hypothetical protein